MIPTLRTKTYAALAATLALASMVNAKDLYIADPAADAVYSVDIDASAAEPTLISASGNSTLGSGPAFEGIMDIAVAPSGRLYVLDGFNGPPRVLEVDRATGDRTLVLQLDQIGFLPYLEIRTNGSYTLARHRFPALGVAPGRELQVIEFAAAFDASPIVNSTRTISSLGTPVDSALVDGRMHLLYPQVHGPWIIAEGTSAGQLIESPNTKFAELSGGSNFTYYSEGGNRGYDATFASVPSTGGRNVLVELQDALTSSIRYDTFLVTPPAGGQQTGRVNTRLTHGATDSGYTSLAPMGAIVANQSAGDWSIRFNSNVPGTQPSAAPVRAAMYQMPSPRATQLANDAGAGIVTVFESFPPAIASFSTGNAAELSRVAVTPPPASGLTEAQLSGASDFDARGTSAFLAMPDDPRLVRIDRTTGASALLTSGRPIALTPPPGGFHVRSPLSFAMQPAAASDATSSWSMY